MKKRFYRVDEVAGVLDVSRKTVYRLIADGFLTAFPVRGKGSMIRITATSIDRYVETQIENFQIDEGIDPESKK